MPKKKKTYYDYLGKEDHLQKSVCDYVWMRYKVRPIPLNTEGRKTKFEQYKFKHTGGHRGIPDVLIPKPMGKYGGLFLELKADGVKIYKEDGSYYKANELHHREQAEYHKGLRINGFQACFVIGFDNARHVIDYYFEL